MVTSYGMSDRLGAVKLGEDNGEPFLGRDIGHMRNYSEEIAAIIDEEVNKLLTNAHQEAFDILVTNRPVLDELVRQLLDKETIDRKGLAAIFSSLRMRAERPAWTGSDSRVPSNDSAGRRAGGAQRPPGAGGRDHRVPGHREPSAPAAGRGPAHGSSWLAAGRPEPRPADVLTGLTWPADRPDRASCRFPSSTTPAPRLR